jgi:hypothetical protein
VIIAVAALIIDEPWRPWSKYWIVLGATVAICVLLYESVLRLLAIARVLFGIKTVEPPSAGSWTAPPACIPNAGGQAPP